MHRLKLEDLNGTVSYSEIVTLMYSDLSSNIVNNAISIYPNPASNTINLSIVQNPLASSDACLVSYNITIISGNGSVVRTLVSLPALSQEDIGNLLPGAYVVQVVNYNDKSVVGEGRFIKL